MVETYDTPTMVKRFLLLNLFILTLISGCIVPKRAADKVITNYVSKNTELVKESVEFAIGVTYNQPKHDFLASDVLDEAKRKQIASLGSSVYVTYQHGDEYEIPDSNVTFKTITPFGITEIIYDFALTQREFADDRQQRDEYYFVKVADRIYYRRRP
jgi:hypothetical protein